MIFPGKCYFLKDSFSKGNFSSFSRIKIDFQIFQGQYSQDFNFLSFDFPSPKSFPMNFNHFPKKVFKVRVFLTNIFLFKCSSFLENSLHFLRIFSHPHKLSGDFQILSSEFPERLISIFFLRNAFPLQMFSKHTSYFSNLHFTKIS